MAIFSWLRLCPSQYVGFVDNLLLGLTTMFFISIYDAPLSRFVNMDTLLRLGRLCADASSEPVPLNGTAFGRKQGRCHIPGDGHVFT